MEYLNIYNAIILQISIIILSIISYFILRKKCDASNLINLGNIMLSINTISKFSIIFLILCLRPEHSQKWNKNITENNYAFLTSSKNFDVTLVKDNIKTQKESLSLENKAIYEMDVLKSKWGDNLVNVKYLTKNNDKYDDKNELIMIRDNVFENLTDYLNERYSEDEDKKRLKSLVD